MFLEMIKLKFIFNIFKYHQSIKLQMKSNIQKECELYKRKHCLKEIAKKKCFGAPET